MCIRCAVVCLSSTSHHHVRCDVLLLSMMMLLFFYVSALFFPSSPISRGVLFVDFFVPSAVFLCSFLCYCCELPRLSFSLFLHVSMTFLCAYECFTNVLGQWSTLGYTF